MGKKIKLEALEVQSFVTSMTINEKNRFRGGASQNLPGGCPETVGGCRGSRTCDPSTTQGGETFCNCSGDAGCTLSQCNPTVCADATCGTNYDTCCG